jgi:hypothetical protein
MSARRRSWEMRSAYSAAGQPELRLISAKSYDSGVIRLRYRA